MSTTCTIRNTKNAILAGGILLSQDKAACQIVLDDLSVPLPDPAQPVILHLVNSASGIRIYHAITARLAGNVLSFEEMKLAKTIQRRNDVKIKATADLVVYPLTREMYDDRMVAVCKIGSQTPVAMADISAGGIGLVCAKELDRSRTYSVVLTFLDEPIELQFVILRCVQQPYGGYFHGCRFQKMPPPHEHALRSFIFQRGRFQSANART